MVRVIVGQSIRPHHTPQRPDGFSIFDYRFRHGKVVTLKPVGIPQIRQNRFTLLQIFQDLKFPRFYSRKIHLLSQAVHGHIGYLIIRQLADVF